MADFVSLALRIEAPELNEKMTAFLATPEGCEGLCAFIARMGPGDVGPEEAARRSCRAAKLLVGTEDGSCDGLTPTMDADRATLVARLVLDTFLDASRGSAVHAVYVLERLFRAHPDSVYAACLEGTPVVDDDDAVVAPPKLEALLGYAGHGCVARLVADLVAGGPPATDEGEGELAG
eukprot:CAMPEP_0119275940 /NCGR_PEP_ID=MMETSP1329-20130426/14613_1 /TAXON_ID=114041 /ORGANISM="Genus nov. species nov., Strain RCC1024" /LENGTH=177 /DNA_ID=CAMNT_0007276361 /DNA_START=125 /DNA_END=655 /DNA_ORIENTATION=-